jgi:hypothetical protein
MKRLIINLLLFAFILVTSFWLIYSYNPINFENNKKNDFLLILQDKEKAVIDMPCRKLLFVGGSGVAFGVDASSVGKKLNVCSYNLGVHAGLGIPFMVNQVMNLARPGDVVVVSSEFYLSQAEIPLKASVVQNMPQMEKYFEMNGVQKIEMHFEMFSKWFFDRVRRVQANFFNGKKEVLRMDENDLYRKAGFSSTGDYIQHLGKERPWGLFTTYDFEKQDYSGEIGALNRLKSLENKGIKVFYIFPAYVDAQFEKNKVALKFFETQLRGGLQFPILGAPEDFLYPDSLFFDTAYHLGKEGREKRASKIAALLQNVIN